MRAEQILGKLEGVRRTRTGWTARCPAHPDHNASLSIGSGVSGRILLHCFAGCTPEAVCAAIGLPLRDLFPQPGAPIADQWRPLLRKAPDDSPQKAASRTRWPAFAVPTPRELERLALLRNCSVRGLELAAERGILRMCDYQHSRCWVITDSAHRVAQVRRFDGAPLRTRGGEAKGITLPGSVAAWPVGLPQADPFPGVMLCEGGPDLLAAHTFIVAEGRDADCAAVAMLGAALSIHPDALPAFAGKAVTIYCQTDQAGAAAAMRWSESLHPFAAHIEVVSFGGLRQANERPVKDLNDLTIVHANDFEAHRWLWGLCPERKGGAA